MKNFILKSITLIAFLTWIITVAAIDSEMYFAQIIVANIISGLWLISHFYINRYYYINEMTEERRRR